MFQVWATLGPKFIDILEELSEVETPSWSHDCFSPGGLISDRVSFGISEILLVYSCEVSRRPRRNRLPSNFTVALRTENEEVVLEQCAGEFVCQLRH